MRLLLLLLAFLSISAKAVQVEYRLDTGTTNLTTSFPSTAQLTGFTQITTVQIYNNTNQEIEVNCSNGTTQPTACTTGRCVGSFHVAAGAAISSPANASISNACFFRANSSNATSGVLYALAWGW